MSAPEAQPPRHRTPSCARCGDVIGVYERLVEVIGELPRHTSRAAEPEVCTSGGACFHKACYELERMALTERRRTSAPPVVRSDACGPADVEAATGAARRRPTR
jgi:hypothetical protein